ncbi:cytochrome c family protein [Calderihabitans maritimus]|uniref:Cytochrome c family protein n=2 Tax=Calderihabitans maritimus TaxID=1246530 RepID=A0A1Z5HR94_9FIRM|nr:cytochrome c family protein [Calderihabitans maritimus]
MAVAFPVLAAATWEVTNSSDFCGTACHLMTPQKVTYKDSAHAEVPCTSCHLGIGLSAEMVMRKATEVTQVWKNLTGVYEKPVRIVHLRPARETCEKCHWTKAFYDDKVKIIQHYRADEENTRSSIALVMKIGGGAAREGKGYGIHWHVENKIQYIATDEEKQKIPWVRVIDPEGNVIDYVDPEAGLTDEYIAKAPKRTMDCIDCHNRVSHLFPSPEEIVDEALASGKIDAGIPWVKKQSIAVLRRGARSKEEFEKAVKEADEFYRRNYPEFYRSKKEILEKTYATWRALYEGNYFPEQEIAWDTYPDNLGHRTFPGCFRCHDGKHVTRNTAVTSARRVIRQDCDLCHSLPIPVQGETLDLQKLVAGLVSNREKPFSHLASDWPVNHGKKQSRECFACHAAKKGETSFCANGGCHGIRWKQPEFRPVYTSANQVCTRCHPVEQTGKHRVPQHQVECLSCHQLHSWTVSDEACRKCHTLDADHYSQPDCTSCHDFRKQERA